MHSSRYFGSLFGDMGKPSSRINIICMQMCMQDSAVLCDMLIYAAQQLWTKFTSKTQWEYF